VKYNALLEGKEITEIDYSKIQIENRYDSEFFQKKFINCERDLKGITYKRIFEKFKVTDGEHGSVVFQERGIKFLTAENIKKGYVDISKIRYVNQEVDKRNARARVNIGDILISIKGTLGEIAIAEEWLLPANMNRDVAILKPIYKDPPSEYVALFLMSRYGNLQSIRGGSGGVQQMITLERLRMFIIPSFSEDFYYSISKLYKNSQQLRVLSQQSYTQAENYLLESIVINNFKPSKDPINIKNFKESFLVTGRLDAEYYQKKYADYLRLIFNYSQSFEYLQKACNLKDTNFTPEDSTEYKYIELANIGNSGEITGCTTALGIDLPSRARRKVKSNDIIVSSIEGSLDCCALVTEDYNNAICSTGFYVINSKKINSETLLVLLKSEPMQNILKQSCSGTILTAINKTEFQNIPIPLIDKTKQELIKEKVSESFALKKTSERLLEKAKRAVELAIEKNEPTAMNFIKRQSV